METKEETKKTVFRDLLDWLTEEQNKATILQQKIDLVYKNGSKSKIDIGSIEFLTMQINLAAHREKVLHIKYELTKLAKLGI